MKRGLAATLALRSKIDLRTRYPEDLALFADLGVGTVRLEFDWALLQPRPGAIDGSTAEWFQRFVDVAHAQGIEVWAALHAGSEPRWFDDEGGFGDARAAGRFWPRWVEAVAERFGDQLDGWMPMSDPIGIAAPYAGDPKRHVETVANTIVAWRDAWRILHGGPPVATDLHLGMQAATDGTVPALQRARAADRLRWTVWLRALRDGMLRLPGIRERVVDDLAGSVDVLGATTTLDLRGLFGDDELSRWRERLGTVVRRLAEEGPGRPLWLSVRTPWPHHAERLQAVEAAVAALGDAVADGIDLAVVAVDPGIDPVPGGSGGGLVDRDRERDDVTDAWRIVKTMSS